MGERGSSTSNTVLWLHVCVDSRWRVPVVPLLRLTHWARMWCLFVAGVCVCARWIVGNGLGKEGAAQALAPSLAMLTQLQSLNLASECMGERGQ